VESVENKRVEFLVHARNYKRVCIRLKTKGMSRVAVGVEWPAIAEKAWLRAGMEIGNTIKYSTKEEGTEELCREWGKRRAEC
jgi:hypothetical protein